MKKLRTLPNLFPSHTKPPAPCFIDESNVEDSSSSSSSPLHQRRGSGRQWQEAWSLSSPLTIISKSPSSVCSSTCSGIAPPVDDVFSRSPSSLWSTGFLLSSIHKTPSTLSSLGSRSEGNASIANEKHNYAVEEGEGAKKDESRSRKSESTISTLYESAKNSREMILEAVSDDETDDDARDSVMGRPKPYAEFLDEVNRQKIDSWKKARDDHLQNRLLRKEAKIEEWELRQIQKAKEEMRNYEKLLEEKRARALERMQERIDCVKIEAENRKKHERHSMLAEKSKVEKISEKMHASKSTTWLRLMSIY